MEIIMSGLRAGVVGFDITPRIHPEFGAWGTTPSMTEIDLPLLARCIALEQDGRRVVWFGSDLVGENVAGTDALRRHVADAIGLPVSQVIWSTSQTHSSGAVPGSLLTGSSALKLNSGDPAFVEAERQRFLKAFCDAGRQAIEQLQPCRVWVGRGYCDSMSYNTRFPMPNGGVKFSRHHAEGLQSGKFFDPTIGLMRIDDLNGRPMGALFNFCSHPATMIAAQWISPDWVGTARELIEDEIAGAPAMFVQGFCGDVNCHHIFGTPDQARETGRRLGTAAAKAMRHLIPLRAEPLDLRWRSLDIPCREMYTAGEIDSHLAARHAFIDEMKHDPSATWFAGVNFPDMMSVEQKTTMAQIQIDYLLEMRRLLETGKQPPRTMQMTVGALRIGDLAAALSPGENFTATGLQLRLRSPFVHTLVCGDTNGLFGYIGDDAEIRRGGYETDSFWKMSYIGGARLAPAYGTVDTILRTFSELLQSLQNGPGQDGNR